MRGIKTSVGVFHRDELNRKALMKLLEKDYCCKEIESWEYVKESSVDILVLCSPELLSPEVSFEKMKETIYSHRASVLMINKDNRKWWIYRLRFIQLRNPSVDQLFESIKELSPNKKEKHQFFRRKERA
jgi:hypothetical protein